MKLNRCSEQEGSLEDFPQHLKYTVVKKRAQKSRASGKIGWILLVKASLNG